MIRSLSSELVQPGVDIIGAAQIFKQRQQVKELRVVHIIKPRNHRNLKERTGTEPIRMLTTVPSVQAVLGWWNRPEQNLKEIRLSFIQTQKLSFYLMYTWKI